jgi:hypothetical protein
MGRVSVARGARDGDVRDLNHPDHPLGGDDLTSARGQLRVVFDRRTDVLLSSDVSDQAAPLLAYNKILTVKPGFTVDNPAKPHHVLTSAIQSSNVRQAGAARA